MACDTLQRTDWSHRASSNGVGNRKGFRNRGARILEPNEDGKDEYKSFVTKHESQLGTIRAKIQETETGHRRESSDHLGLLRGITTGHWSIIPSHHIRPLPQSWTRNATIQSESPGDTSKSTNDITKLDIEQHSSIDNINALDCMAWFCKKGGTI